MVSMSSSVKWNEFDQMGSYFSITVFIISILYTFSPFWKETNRNFLDGKGMITASNYRIQSRSYYLILILISVKYLIILVKFII